MIRYLFLLFCCFQMIQGEETFQTVPVSYNGRFIPLEVALKLQLQDWHGKTELKKEKLTAYDFFLKLYGGHSFDQTPLFLVHYATTKKALGLKVKESHFSYQQLKSIFEKEIEGDEALQLMGKVRTYEHLKPPKNLSYEKSLAELKEKGKSPEEIADALESAYPLQKRLVESGHLFKALPDKQHLWHSIDALGLKIYDKESDSLKKIGNFTLYSDAAYQKIQNAYHLESFEQLGIALNEAYQEIEQTVYKEAYQKTLLYPSKGQLKAELYYYRYPFVKTAAILYLLALIGLIFGKTSKERKIETLAFIFLALAFSLHTGLLVLRAFILNRPPVSNMFETVLYVPWITTLAGFIFYRFEKNRWLLIASSFVSLLLLLLLEITGMHQNLVHVQAVLDSNYWLTVHVLLIVGSYGLFFLSGLLGQIYLGYTLFRPNEKQEMRFLSKFILQTMYFGVFMLIPGTILGGIWAAESWGRFWDWDPKESWAFISSSLYLAVIHAFRFHKISSFGLSFGAVVGLMAISFTWYGVNYILGTGLHSYGFGTGNDLYYYIFLLLQTAFLIIVSIKYQKRLELKSKNMV